MSTIGRRPPVVTDLDRKWAIDQKPSTWDAEAPDLAWELHVAEQAESFERELAGDRKPPEEWSGLWRRVWWPKADPAIRHPQTAPRVLHPFVRGDAECWLAALRVLDADERRVAERFGIIQFRPDDPRAAVIRNTEGADA